jgi:transcriptional antiterminator RfaH
MIESRWFAARTKPGQTQVALDGLMRQGFDTYFPRLAIECIKNGKRITRHQPLFPGYLLVQMALATATWQAINATRGIVRMLSSIPDGPPSPIRKGEIESLKMADTEGKLKVSEISDIRKGDTVMIKEGPFAGTLALVKYTKRERVELLFSLLGRQTRVIGSVASLELVQKGKGNPTNAPRAAI